ncbi:MAG: IS200/IS605 family transposase [Planctomycetes bacterium]|nr:IS200/IS605 family transposase [Planctomycetota bacterium]
MVFATKERRPLITPDLKPKLHAYMAGTVKSLGCHVHALDGVADHCHLVFDLAPKLALADFANKLKAGATGWAREDGHREFGWQRGYRAFSMNQESLESAVQYVKNQESHHAKTSFRDELEGFMKLHGMEVDPEFVDGLEPPLCQKE